MGFSGIRRLRLCRDTTLTKGETPKWSVTIWESPLWSHRNKEEVVNMPHTARRKSETGFYHVVAKGAGGQVIFENAADRRSCLEEFEKAVDSHKVDVHAYCLMSNHIHILLQDNGDCLGDFMKQLCQSYAMHFKRITGRVGSVFQKPYWSEAVGSDEYYLNAMRYIHANPEPAGICPAAQYEWSSYQAYLGAQSFVKTDLALGLLGDAEAFAAFSASGAKLALPFPESNLRSHLTPDEAWRIAEEILGHDVAESLRRLTADERKPHLQALFDAGFTEREIARISGLGKTAIHLALS